jgi:hypothetical protein
MWIVVVSSSTTSTGIDGSIAMAALLLRAHLAGQQPQDGFLHPSLRAEM